MCPFATASLSTAWVRAKRPTHPLSHQIISIFFLFIYGLGIPFSFFTLGHIMKHVAGKKTEQHTLAFLMSGYQYSYRYWEVMFMLQKMGIVVLVNFVTHPVFRIYSVMWLIAFFMGVTQVCCCLGRPIHSAEEVHWACYTHRTGTGDDMPEMCVDPCLLSRAIGANWLQWKAPKTTE